MLSIMCWAAAIDEQQQLCLVSPWLADDLFVHNTHLHLSIPRSPLITMPQAALKRLLAEGHELGSHAAGHLHLSRLRPKTAKQHIEWAIGNISTVTGSTSVPVRSAGSRGGWRLCLVVRS